VGYANEIWVNPTNGSNIETANGQQGTDWIEVAHAAGHAIGPYYPSSRISIHVNNPDGSALQSTMAPGSIELLKAAISEVMTDILPAHVSIRFFVTDLPGGSFWYLPDSLLSLNFTVLTEGEFVTLTEAQFASMFED